ncbi:hypothetical protein [Pseudalkalibacillus hwajinpoensis]|uniref:hypothetical protein n=1 Tax=Guptibacillus hwajinpoensis TaxID=208199 RepID=UPI003851393A
MIKLRKIWLVCAMVLIFTGVGYGYVQFKFLTSKKAVECYLINEMNISKESFEEIDPFIGNLPGDKNWLVYVKIKGDERRYTYYLNRTTDKVILESYTLNGKLYVE